MKRVLAFACAAGGGLIAVVLSGKVSSQEADFFEVVRAGVEAASGLTVLLLVGAGYGARRVAAVRPLVLGLATVATLPVIALIDVAFIDPTSHNLLPVEFIVYAMGALPGCLGAWLPGRGRPDTGQRSS